MGDKIEGIAWHKAGIMKVYMMHNSSIAEHQQLTHLDGLTR